MEQNDEFLQLENKIVEVLKNIYDPEMPANIFDLGLIYNIDVNEKNEVKIDMTLTSPNCPVAELLPSEVKQKIEKIANVKKVTVKIVFEPSWDKSMMSEEARLELGFL
ncbi:MAG: SUF system Fe-S cluster assembly protein [Bacteroidales bacterium]|nr:SUF system Fe-S cluster assembly protein [Bacteroidales bacterium]